MQKISFYDIIESIRSVEPVLRTTMENGKAIETLGPTEWHIVLKESRMNMNIGAEPPDWEVGQRIKITLGGD